MSFSDFITDQGKKINKGYFVTLIQVCRIDGNISPAEMEMLHKEGKKFGLTEPEIDKLIKSESSGEYHTPYSLTDKFEQLYNVGVMILADKIITEQELKAFRRLATEAGFNEDAIESLRIILLEGIANDESEEVLLGKFKKELFKK